MWRAYRSQWMKIRRPSVLAAAGAMLFFTLVGTYFGITRAQGREGGAAFIARASESDGLVYLLQRGADIVTVIALITVCAVTAAEWSQGTLRNLLVHEAGRLRLLAGNYLALFTYVLLAVLVSTGVGIALSFALAPGAGISTALWTSSDGWSALQHFLLDMLVALVGWTLFGSFVAVLVRNAAAAVGMSIAWLLIIETLSVSIWPELARWFPGHIIETVLNGPNGGNPASQAYVSYSNALWLSLVYAVGFAVVSGVLFRERDVTA